MPLNMISHLIYSNCYTQKPLIKYRLQPRAVYFLVFFLSSVCEHYFTVNLFVYFKVTA